MMKEDVHRSSLATSTALSLYYFPQLIPPLEVIAVLRAAGVRPVLVGTHALGGWMHKPRTTADVDVLTAARNHKKAVAALRMVYPGLCAEEKDGATRLRNPDSETASIDVMKAIQPLLRAVLRRTYTVECGGEKYEIPSLEAALAMKFAAMMNPGRKQQERYQDAHDFLCIIGANEDVELPTLAALGELAHPAGGKEVVELVRKVRAGEKLRF